MEYNRKDEFRGPDLSGGWKQSANPAVKSAPRPETRDVPVTETRDVVVVVPEKTMPDVVVVVPEKKKKKPPVGITPEMPVLDGEESCGYCITPGMSYTPMTKWNDVYEPEVGFHRGTIFPELDYPFVGEEACKE